MCYDSRAIANKVMDIADHNKISVTPLKLVKLVYLTKLWWSVLSEGQELTRDKEVEGQYGPMHSLVYRSFIHNGTEAIKDRAVDSRTGLEFYEDLSSRLIILIEQIVRSYGNFRVYQLSDIIMNIKFGNTENANCPDSTRDA